MRNIRASPLGILPIADGRKCDRMTIVASVVLTLLFMLLGAGVVCVITRAGAKEGICNYDYTENNEEDNNND